MIDAGHIDIALSPGAVSIVSTRSKAIARLFIGKAPDGVAALVPALFTVCGAAHSRASAVCLAKEGAGRAVAGAASQVVAAEAMREHLMRIAVDWQKAVSAEAPAAGELRRIHRLPRLAAADPAALSGEADALLQQWIGTEEAILAGPGVLVASQTPAARLIRSVMTRGWDGVGAAGSSLPDERTAYRLVAAESCIAALARDHGDGLLPRLYARLVHAACLARQLRRNGVVPDMPASDTVARESGWSEAHVPTSRGLLTHRARLEKGLVAAYEITAPTDVNFAVDGPAERALLKLSGEMQDDLADAARLLVEAFDPCVAYGLRVQ